MAHVPVTFGNGQLPSSAAALFTVAAGKAAIFGMTLFNVSGASVTVKLWKTISGNHRQFYGATLAAGEFAALEGIQLSAGEALRGEASAATSIDWTAHGAEVTL